MKNRNFVRKEELLELLPVVRRYAVALTANRADADDLLQTTVERLLCKTPPTGVALKAWILKVCRNIWIDEIRSRKVRQADDWDDNPSAGAEDGEEIIMTKMNLDQVMKAVAKLPEEQRAVLGLVALEGYTYKEAAAILETPVGTVMSRLSRARANLVDYMNHLKSLH